MLVTLEINTAIDTLIFTETKPSGEVPLFHTLQKLVFAEHISEIILLLKAKQLEKLNKLKFISSFFFLLFSTVLELLDSTIHVATP